MGKIERLRLEYARKDLRKVLLTLDNGESEEFREAVEATVVRHMGRFGQTFSRCGMKMVWRARTRFFYVELDLDVRTLALVTVTFKEIKEIPKEDWDDLCEIERFKDFIYK